MECGVIFKTQDKNEKLEAIPETQEPDISEEEEMPDDCSCEPQKVDVEEAASSAVLTESELSVVLDSCVPPKPIKDITIVEICEGEFCLKTYLQQPSGLVNHDAVAPTTTTGKEEKLASLEDNTVVVPVIAPPIEMMEVAENIQGDMSQPDVLRCCHPNKMKDLLFLVVSAILLTIIFYNSRV